MFGRQTKSLPRLLNLAGPTLDGTSRCQSRFDACVLQIGEAIETGKLLVMPPIELLGGK